MNRSREAIPAFDEAIRLNPKAAVSHRLRGLARFDVGDTANAENDFDEAVQREPNNARNYYNRGRCRRLLKRHDEALADQNRAIKLDAKYRLAFQERGNVYDALVDRELPPMPEFD